MERWFILGLVAFLTALNGLTLFSLGRIRNEYVKSFNWTLKELASEWNKVTQTINALMGNMAPSEAAHSQPETADMEKQGDGLPASKAELYRQARR
jgi:hypothetical protein